MNALYILRIENILKKMIIIFIVDHFSFIKFHIIALQFIMNDFLRNDDEMIFHSRAYQFEMLKKSLNDHQMNIKFDKTNMHVFQNFWNCFKLAINSIKKSFYELKSNSSVSRQKRCLFSNVLEWLLKIFVILFDFSARSWYSSNNNTRFFSFNFRHFKANCFLIMMKSIDEANKTYETTRWETSTSSFAFIKCF